jgi:lactate permease
MELGLQALLAFTPIALSGVLLVGLGWSAKRRCRWSMWSPP